MTEIYARPLPGIKNLVFKVEYEPLANSKPNDQLWLEWHSSSFYTTSQTSENEGSELLKLFVKLPDETCYGTNGIAVTGDLIISGKVHKVTINEYHYDGTIILDSEQLHTLTNYATIHQEPTEVFNLIGESILNGAQN